MTALTPAERQELLAQIDSLSSRAVDKDREVRTLRHQIEALTDDVANGVAGARGKVLKLDDEARGAQLELDACERAKAAAEARYAADQPYRDAEAAAARRDAAMVIATRMLQASSKIDEGLRLAVSGIEERQEGSEALAPFIDIVGRAPEHVPAIIATAFASAGLTKFDGTFQKRPDGQPNTFEERDADALRGVLPDDHPVVRALQREADRRHAEYRRQFLPRTESDAERALAD